jgi:hypothetical protein
MSTTDANGVTTAIASLPKLTGTHLGYTDWQQMSQERVNQCADPTDDHQFIHVDPERAKATPFGGTIAHGFLTLSLVAPISQVDEIKGGAQIKMLVTIEMKGSRKPAVVAESLTRVYG